MMKQISVGIIAAIGFCTAVQSQTSPANDVSSLRTVQLVVTHDCETARQVIANSAELIKLNIDDRQALYIAVEQCAVNERNALLAKEPEKQEVTVVAPDEDGRIFFKSIKRTDAEALADICKTVSRVAIGLIPDLSTQALSAKLDAGKVQCQSLLKSAVNDNPLIILAPEYVTGPAMTVAALRAIGLKKPAAEIQKQITDVDQRIGQISRETGAEIKKHPLILLAGPTGVAATAVVKAVGKDMCRLKISCKKVWKCKHTCS